MKQLIDLCSDMVSDISKLVKKHQGRDKAISVLHNELVNGLGWTDKQSFGEKMIPRDSLRDDSFFIDKSTLNMIGETSAVSDTRFGTENPTMRESMN